MNYYTKEEILALLFEEKEFINGEAVISQEQIKKVCFDVRTPPEIHQKMLAMLQIAEKYLAENKTPKNEFFSIPLTQTN